MLFSSKVTRYAVTLLTGTAALWLAGFIIFGIVVNAMTPPATGDNTDAVIVLTGGPERINTGLDLLDSGIAQKLFISGVDSRVTAEELIALWNKDRDAPPCCISLGHKAANTRQNAQETQHWVAENNIKSARLVTADYHMPRAFLEFSYTLPDLNIKIHPVASVTYLGKPRKFWYYIFEEYHKTLYTWFRLTFFPHKTGS